MTDFVLICLAVASAGFVVGRAQLLGPLRELWRGWWHPELTPYDFFGDLSLHKWMEKNKKKRTKARAIISKFLDCPWCISVWVALAAAQLFPNFELGFLCWWMAISGGSLLALGLMQFALRSLDGEPGR